MNPSQRYEFTVHTFGCKVNTYDTGLLQQRFEADGHRAVSAKQTSDFGLGARVPRVHILNTCAVTAEASKEAAKLARRLKAKDPFSTVVVTGCGAQVDGSVFDDLSAADLVVANSHKGRLERLLDEYFKGSLESKVHRSNIFRKEDLEAGGGVEASHTRAFLKIQDGCNSFCTYCVIPFARGKSRSLSVTELVARIRELGKRPGGLGEVVLTGVHIGDYEDEQAGRKFYLHDLVAAVLEKTDVPRVRLTSLEPPELTPELMALFANERMCRHFHMSIQSAQSRVLRDMRRKYDAQAVEESLFKIEKLVPESFVGMDVITGFPGETEEEFAETYERLSRLPWTRIHVFPYSERPGTKAAQFEGVVPREIRSLRAQRLRDLSSQRLEASGLRQRGRLKQALVLRGKKGEVEALSRDYWPMHITHVDGRPMDEALRAEVHRELSGRVGQEISLRAVDYVSDERLDGVLLGDWHRSETMGKN